MSAEVDIATLRQQREAIVLEHAAAESAQDVERTLACFHRPRYDIKPLGKPYDGPDAVRELLATLYTAFPDFSVEPVRLHHADEAVIVETILTGTQEGEFAGLAPTGRSMSVPLCTIFEFDGDKLIGEQVFFDLSTVIRQLQA